MHGRAAQNFSTALTGAGRSTKLAWYRPQSSDEASARTVRWACQDHVTLNMYFSEEMNTLENEEEAEGYGAWMDAKDYLC